MTLLDGGLNKNLFHLQPKRPSITADKCVLEADSPRGSVIDELGSLVVCREQDTNFQASCFCLEEV